MIQTATPLAPQQDGMLAFRSDVHAMRGAHRHLELEMNLVTRGTASYLLGSRRYNLRPRTLVWLFAAQEHILLERSPDCQMWLGVFSPALLAEACRTEEMHTLLSPDPPGHFCRVLSETEAATLETLLARVAAEEGDARRFGLTYAVLSAWDVFARAEGAPSGTDIHPAVERAARLVRDEGADALSLAQLADAVGLSPAYLSALFKAQTGMALTAFRARQRIEGFLRLYGAGHRVSMLEAALDAGFGSYPQFHRVFREVMGCGPAEYFRKRSTWKTQQTQLSPEARQRPPPPPANAPTGPLPPPREPCRHVAVLQKTSARHGGDAPAGGAAEGKSVCLPIRWRGTQNNGARRCGAQGSASARTRECRRWR